MPPCSSGSSWSYQRLEIGPHHVLHPADAGRGPQLVHRRLPPPEAVAEGLKGHIEPDLAAILEAIGHRLGWRVDIHSDSLNPVPLNHRGKRRAARADDPELRG